MNNNIRKIIDDNWEDIKELIAKKVEAEQKPKTIWGLKKEDGEDYYRLYSDGDIEQVVFYTDYDEQARDIGNVFLTREEAEFECERRKVEVIMRKYSRPFKYDEYNYHIEYDYDDNTLDISVYRRISVGIPYFESEEIVQQVIDKIGEDRLKKYWFGVTE